MVVIAVVVFYLFTFISEYISDLLSCIFDRGELKSSVLIINN